MDNSEVNITKEVEVFTRFLKMEGADYVKKHLTELYLNYSRHLVYFYRNQALEQESLEFTEFGNIQEQLHCLTVLIGACDASSKRPVADDIL